MTTDFVYMGFPKRTFDGSASYGFDGNAIQLFSTAYICPRCYNRTSEIPTQCCVCKVQLNSSSHIARSHHHLFPVPNFDELSVTLSKDKKSLRAYKMLLSEPEKELGIRKSYPVSSTAHDISVKEENVQNDAKIEAGVEAGGGVGVEVEKDQNDDVDFVGVLSSCKGCLETFTKISLVMQCPLCENIFCIECDLFIHNSLHNCPGCIV
jgi:transcription initiation factor TFIIH subunit 2